MGAHCSLEINLNEELVLRVHKTAHIARDEFNVKVKDGERKLGNKGNKTI